MLVSLDVEKSSKVIIAGAVTGSIHTPTVSDALPVTPDEIAQPLRFVLSCPAASTCAG
jgi:uncharacterized protein (DUF849 family)